MLVTGVDIIEIDRVRGVAERYGQRFFDRIYTAGEQGYCRGRAPQLASRFAAKEACAKALGTGFRQGIFWRDMVVANHPTGQPYLVLSGGAQKRLQSLIPRGMEPRIDVSQTDEYPMAQAVVVISAVPHGVPQDDAS